MNAQTQTKAQEKRAAIEADVTMSDGITPINVRHGVLTLDFANGQSIVVKTADLPTDVISQAIMHGLKQKLVDAAAISRDPDTGRAASIDVKFRAVEEVANRLFTGEWNKRREGGGSAGGLLYQALCRKYSAKTPEQIKEWLDGKDDKAKAALRKNPDIAKIIDEIRAEKGDAGAAADLLAELDEMEG
jgi:hypothetical protein